MEIRNASLRRNEKGVAATETAITIMTFLLLILGIMQITLVINARLLMNYAAYSAARAGIVHNGDITKMQQAAAVALAPMLSNDKSLPSLGLGYGKAHALLALGLLKVQIISSGKQRFKPGYRKRFFPALTRYRNLRTAEEVAQMQENLLTVRVTYFYPLKIPLINAILSPLFRHVKLTATHQMRMQSDDLFKG